MRRSHVTGILSAIMAIGVMPSAGFYDASHPFVGYEYVRPLPQNLPANTSPYDDLTNRNVYEMGPAYLDVFPEPSGIPGQSNPFSHFFSKSEPDLGAPPDAVGSARK